MRSRKLLACAFFITLALSTTPTVAQSPSHCDDTDPNEIECLTLTVEDFYGELGFVDNLYGSLDPDHLNFFDYNGTIYEINLCGLNSPPLAAYPIPHERVYPQEP